MNEGKYRPAKEFSIKFLRVQPILTQTLQLSNNNFAIENTFFFIEISSNLWFILLFYINIYLTSNYHHFKLNMQLKKKTFKGERTSYLPSVTINRKMEEREGGFIGFCVVYEKSEVNFTNISICFFLL